MVMVLLPATSKGVMSKLVSRELAIDASETAVTLPTESRTFPLILISAASSTATLMWPRGLLPTANTCEKKNRFRSAVSVGETPGPQTHRAPGTVRRLNDQPWYGKP